MRAWWNEWREDVTALTLIGATVTLVVAFGVTLANVFTAILFR